MCDLESLRGIFGDLLMRVCLSVLLLIACGSAIARLAKATGRPIGALWRKSRSIFVALALLACCTTLDAEKTNTMLRVIHGLVTSVQTVSEDDIARCYRQESMTTNLEPFAEMPSNAVEYARWSLRGGFAADFALHLGNFVFPVGTNRVSRFDVLSGGAVEPLPRGTSAAIYAAREQASLVPGVSRFWSADADDGAKVLRWDRVFAGRDSTGEYTAEMRFFQNGDFTTRSNEVETAYRRVNPDDWDDDGIANERDANPTSYDGDFFGVANALPSNANMNAYYWLDLSVTGLLDCATIRVTCDGPSDLGDHLIVARTNEVCHIPLLAGATYAVESDLPIDYSAVSTEHAEIVANSENRLTVSLPLELYFERVQMRSGGGAGDALTANYALHSSPIDVGALLASLSGGCCSCETNAFGFAWLCSENCLCDGEHRLYAVAAWDGYYRAFSWHGPCSCTMYEPEPSTFTGDGISLSIEMPSTFIANDDDDNDNGLVDAEPPFADKDDEITEGHVSFSSILPTSGAVKLQRLTGLEQGTNGTRRVYADKNGLSPVDEGHEYAVSGSSSLERDFFVNPAVTSSHYQDGRVRVLWKPNSGACSSVSKRFTIVEPTAEPITDESWSLADFADDGRLHSYLYNPCAVVVGKTATFKVDVLPEDYPDSKIIWTTNMCEGAVNFVGSNVNTGRVVTVEGARTGQVFLSASIGDSESVSPTFMMQVVTETTVRLRVWIIGNGSQWARTETGVRDAVAVANDIYRQVGVTFELVEPIIMTNIPSAYNPTIGVEYPERWKVDQVVSLAEGTDGLECYFINHFYDEATTVGYNCPSGMVLTSFADGQTLAHEIGHAFGLRDIYVSNASKTNNVVTLKAVGVDERPSSDRLELDWNCGCDGHGAGGVRYYGKSLMMRDIIERLLMNGDGPARGRDISYGSVFGVLYEGEGKLDGDWRVDQTPVGFFSDPGATRNPIHK